MARTNESAIRQQREKAYAAQGWLQMKYFENPVIFLKVLQPVTKMLLDSAVIIGDL